MQKTLWNEIAREELLARVKRLSPETKPLWGKMNATQMVAHMNQWFRLATGEIEAAPRKMITRFPVVKQFIIYVMPWPKGVPTAKELIIHETGNWVDEVSGFSLRLREFGKLESKRDWLPHPAFGQLSPRTWGALGYRHTHHHLRQFGV